MKLKQFIVETIYKHLREQEDTRQYSKFPLNSLVKFAKQFDDFKQFDRWYSLELNHGYYWHITDNKDFRISDTIGPRDMSSLVSGEMNPEDAGDLMVTGDLEYWDEHYNKNERSPGVKRKYVVLFDASELNPKALKQVSRGFGNEIYLHKSDAKKLKLIGVYSREYAKRLDNKFHSMIPQSEKELYDLWLFSHRNV